MTGDLALFEQSAVAALRAGDEASPGDLREYQDAAGFLTERLGPRVVGVQSIQRGLGILIRLILKYSSKFHSTSPFV